MSNPDWAVRARLRPACGSPTGAGRARRRPAFGKAVRGRSSAPQTREACGMGSAERAPGEHAARGVGAGLARPRPEGTCGLEAAERAPVAQKRSACQDGRPERAQPSIAPGEHGRPCAGFLDNGHARGRADSVVELDLEPLWPLCDDDFRPASGRRSGHVRRRGNRLWWPRRRRWRRCCPWRSCPRRPQSTHAPCPGDSGRKRCAARSGLPRLWR